MSVHSVVKNATQELSELGAGGGIFSFIFNLYFASGTECRGYTDRLNDDKSEVLIWGEPDLAAEFNKILRVWSEVIR